MKHSLKTSLNNAGYEYRTTVRNFGLLSMIDGMNLPVNTVVFPRIKKDDITNLKCGRGLGEEGSAVKWMMFFF